MKWIRMALIFVRSLNKIYLWGVGKWKPNTIKCPIPTRFRQGPKETTSFEQRIGTFSNELIPQGMIPACCCIVMICQCLTQHTTLFWSRYTESTQITWPARTFLPKKSNQTNNVFVFGEQCNMINFTAYMEAGATRSQINSIAFQAKTPI